MGVAAIDLDQRELDDEFGYARADETIAVNTGPSSPFSACDGLDLLRQLHRHVLVPAGSSRSSSEAAQARRR